MSLGIDGPFVFFALLYATGAAAGVLIGLGRFKPRNRARLLPLLLSGFFFVFLTQSPFPAPAALVCPLLRGVPQLEPFHYWATVQDLWTAGSRWQDWVFNRMIAATVMNVLIPAAIGVALAAHPVSTRVALGVAMGLTVAVELTQLTGVWGIYPCAYRQFNVDDLMLNTTGLFAGFIMARRYLFATKPALPAGPG